MESVGSKQNASEQLDEIVSEAEKRLKSGMRVINQWGSQARELVDRQPVALIVGAAALGFVTGMLMRRAYNGSASKKRENG